MLCIVDSTTDPYWNLAAEEYLLTALSEPVFRLWRNVPSVIVGRYQNAAAEINSEYVRTRGIPVVRRLTGGGAVFHDLGNVNYTFIDRKVEGEDTAAMFRAMRSASTAAGSCSTAPCFSPPRWPTYRAPSTPARKNSSARACSPTARGSPTSRSICPPGTVPCQWRSSSLIFRTILQAVRTLSAATPHRRWRP